MCSNIKKTLDDISGLSENAATLTKKATRRSPRMKKEITIRSKYYSPHREKHPVAETLMQLEIDCSLLKLALIAAGCAIMIWAFCKMRKERT